jgi:hypothetical protein
LASVPAPFVGNLATETEKTRHLRDFVFAFFEATLFEIVRENASQESNAR